MPDGFDPFHAIVVVEDLQELVNPGSCQDATACVAGTAVGGTALGVGGIGVAEGTSVGRLVGTTVTITV